MNTLTPTLSRRAGEGVTPRFHHVRWDATPWLMLAPALVATTLLVLLPVADTVWLSLHDVVLFRPRTQPFVGLANYARAVADPVFWSSLGNSVIWVGCAVSLQFLLGFGAALHVP